MPTTWIFGSSSNLSKEIIKNLDNPVCFGRHNVDYSDPEKFIEEHLTKDIIEDSSILNIFVNIPLEFDINDSNGYKNGHETKHSCLFCRSNPIYSNECVDSLCHLQTPEMFKLSLCDMADNIFFFYRLLSITTLFKKSVKVCYITSSMPNSTYYGKYDEQVTPLSSSMILPTNFLYASGRALQQFSFASRDNEFCRTVGVSPSFLSDETLPEYAKIIAELLQTDMNDAQWGKVCDLSNGNWYEYKNFK